MDNKINDCGPAYPSQPLNAQGLPCNEHLPGMTLRDYFAAAALQGMLATQQGFEAKSKELAEWAYNAADAMIAKGEKSK